MKQRILRSGVSLVCAFLLALSLAAAVPLLVFKDYRATKDGVTRYLTDGYVTESYVGLLDDWNSLVQPSGFPAHIFDGVTDKETLGADLRAYAQGQWSGELYEVPTAHLRARLMEAFMTYITENGDEVHALIRPGLGTLADLCVAKYRTRATVPLLGTVTGALRAVDGLADLALYFLAGLAAAALLLLLLLHKRAEPSLRYTAYAAWAAAGVLLPLPLWLWATRPYATVDLRPAHVRTVYVTLLDDTLYRLTLCGAAVAIAAAVLCGAAVVAGVVARRKARNTAAEAEDKIPEN